MFKKFFILPAMSVGVVGLLLALVFLDSTNRNVYVLAIIAYLLIRTVLLNLEEVENRLAEAEERIEALENKSQEE